MNARRRSTRLARTCFAAALAALALARPARGLAWPHDPYVGGVTVCAASGDQQFPVAVADGAGGVFVAWHDYRPGNGTSDIYAQHLDATGQPLWTANGVGLCTTAALQVFPSIALDGAGGVIVAWADQRSGGYDVYAQRVNAAGAPQWAANGVLVCGAANDQSSVLTVTDGALGAIVAWVDARNGNLDVYAQRLNAAGTGLWTANGTPVCTVAGAQQQLAMKSDGAGGAFLAWQDARGATPDIYAQRLNSSGASLWGPGGRGLCLAAGTQEFPDIVDDGASGAIIAWQDLRGADYDLYAQHMSAGGVTLWAADGVTLCSAPALQQFPLLASDGSGGAIAVWFDDRGGTGPDVYAQRLSAGGVLLWTATGVLVSNAANEQVIGGLVPDGVGGAIVSWRDRRNGAHYDIYAQRLNAIGTPQWATGGLGVSLAGGHQQSAIAVSDGRRGAIVVFTDRRANAIEEDITAQRVEHFGVLGDPEPRIQSVRDVANDQGGHVKVSWTASWIDAEPTFGVLDYRLWRSVPAGAAAALASGATDDADRAAAEGRWLTMPLAGAAYLWELVGTQPSAGLAGYSLVSPTTSDSLPGSFPHTVFMVEARAGASQSAPRWFSEADSGYSVDNLAPGIPAPFAGAYGAGVTHLTWNPNLEPDLDGYRLYRGTTPAFLPDAAHLLATQADTGYTDAVGAPYVYKLTAVDVHGNESAAAVVVPGGVVDVPGERSAALALGAPSPNPARGTFAIDYTLPHAAHVTLALYDAAGRRVRVAREGAEAAGRHAASFGGTDGPLAPGLYLVRLSTGGRMLARRAIVVR